jgi:hypothetical protein
MVVNQRLVNRQAGFQQAAVGHWEKLDKEGLTGMVEGRISPLRSAARGFASSRAVSL